jgi:hypothetical protein
MNLRTMLGPNVAPEFLDACEHTWEVIDDTFSHEFGTEVVVFECCELCGETRDFDDSRDREDAAAGRHEQAKETV